MQLAAVTVLTKPQFIRNVQMKGAIVHNVRYGSVTAVSMRETRNCSSTHSQTVTGGDSKHRW